MKWKEFLKPNHKIAAILILLPIAIFLISIALFFLIADEAAKIIIGTVIGASVPATYIAAVLLIKTKKVLTYYYVVSLPLTIIEMLMFFASGAIPIGNFSSVEPSLQVFFVYILASNIFISLAIKPAFLIVLPRYLFERKKNLNLSLFFPFVALTLINLYPLKLIEYFIAGLSTPDAAFFALATFDIYSILDITVLTEIVSVSVLAYIFYRIFSSMLRNRKKK